MLKVSNIRVPVGEPEDQLMRWVARQLRVSPESVGECQILRKSLDVRNKRQLRYVYTAAVTLEDEQHYLKRPGRTNAQIAAYEPKQFDQPQPGEQPMEHRPVVVGSGPAGLFAAYQLAELGYCPIVLERGQAVRERIREVRRFDAGGPLDPENNYLFGEGGAGTFSDGKLTCRTTGIDTNRVLEIFCRHKGKPSVLYEAKPHLGSNRLPAVVKSLRQQIEEWGGEFRFGCRVSDLIVQQNQITGVQVNSNEVLPSSIVILATGHSARDVFDILLKHQVPIEYKAFQLGVRIEQPQEQVNQAQYGSSPQAVLLGPADYTLNVRTSDREVFTFCMCAGGYVMPSVSRHGYFCTNGMSRSGHESPFANSGLVVTMELDDLKNHFRLPELSDPMAGVRYQEEMEKRAYEMGGENYAVPIQSAQDFLAQRSPSGPLTSSYPRDLAPMNLWDLLPTPLAKRLAEGLPMMNERWRGLFLEHATLVGPEARGSCPIRMVRDVDTRQSPGFAGLYPIGEGAGYAGGIVSAAIDGLKTAKAVIRQYQPAGR